MPKKLVIIDDRKEKQPAIVKFTYSELLNMAALGLTQEQMAYIKGIRPATITENKRKNKLITEAIKKGKAIDLADLLKRLRKLATDERMDVPHVVQLNALKTLLNLIHGLNEKNILDIQSKGEKLEPTKFVFIGKNDEIPVEFENKEEDKEE